MTTSSDLAARILINYEASLKCDGKDTLAERLDAMRRTVEALHLREVEVSDDPNADPYIIRT